MFDSKIILSFILLCNQILSDWESDDPNVNPEEYLRKYGYLETTERSEDYIREALKTFQMFYRLPVTGVFDETTRRVMSAPRCGNKDPVIDFKKKINSRYQQNFGYSLQGSKWTNYKLTYKISAYSTRVNMDKNETLNKIKEAFNIWSAVTPLRFIHVTDLTRKVHIEFVFARSYHPGHPFSTPFASKFDGEGNTLAHAAYPEHGGDLHYDDDDQFAFDNNQNGSSFLYVSTHEIGHSLGLEHSPDMFSIMFSREFAKGGVDLTKDDIEGIRVLYGDESIILP